MPVTDPIADMLTRIRNANHVGDNDVDMPASRIKVSIAKVLREEGFIKHYKVIRPRSKGKRKTRDTRDRRNPLETKSMLRIHLKYGPNKERVICGLQRVSRPGLRRYLASQNVPLIEGGLGITIISTSRGLLTGAQCRQRNIGGEFLCKVW